MKVVVATMYEKVEVKQKNNDGTVEVACPTSACKGCKGNSFCNVKGKTFQAMIDKQLQAEIKPGDKVNVYLPPAKTIRTTFITLMIPLMMFPLFYFLFPLKADFARFLVSVGGVGVGFAGVGIYFHLRKKRYYPHVISREDDRI